MRSAVRVYHRAELSRHELIQQQVSIVIDYVLDDPSRDPRSDRLAFGTGEIDSDGCWKNLGCYETAKTKVIVHLLLAVIGDPDT